ncbi:hypothetical protein Pla123a_05780 [Posidoniimonas polymericola]|uniref:CAP-Gly protein n=1 Tax=Posidoniimonas polymericola TaxID=2528002 RepID=A0A5C5ZFY9_9BACT|nr:MFS transporter [Posidoniimonas polymericola]TWT85771.1 hypothetical protein Pla123a_05780 [Posidoniimonas polymericola]
MEEHVVHDGPHSHTHTTIQEPHALWPRLSWGAIFAGLVVTLSLCWLLHMFGLALGVSISDAYDSATMEGGLDDAAAAWTIVSWLIAFFIGSMVAARLAGSIDDFAGMLHGLTLWGVGTLAAVAISYYGLSMLLGVGQSALSATASVAVDATQAVGSAAQTTGQAVGSALQTQTAQRVKNRLADQAVEMAANVDQQLSEQEIRDAVNSLDERTIRRLSQDLLDNDSDGAAELLSGATELSKSDARALVNGVYEEVEETIGDPDNEKPLREDLKQKLAGQVSGYAESLDAEGGPEVKRAEIREAIRELDAAAAQQIAMAMYNGKPEEAKRALARNTTLSSDEIEELWEGASTAIEEEIESYKQAAHEMAETAGDYAQAVLWVTFGGAATALAVALLGGWLGAHTGRATYVIES